MRFELVFNKELEVSMLSSSEVCISIYLRKPTISSPKPLILCLPWAY